MTHLHPLLPRRTRKTDPRPRARRHSRKGMICALATALALGGVLAFPAAGSAAEGPDRRPTRLVPPPDIPAIHIPGIDFPDRWPFTTTKPTIPVSPPSTTAPLAPNTSQPAKPAAPPAKAAPPRPAAKPKAKPAAKTLPATVASARQYALALLGSRQYRCLNNLWDRESGWRPRATNPTSGAYGIPQALPGSKMASAGPDWRTNPLTQVKWGLSYIKSRYGTPCGAWSHSQRSGWY